MKSHYLLAIPILASSLGANAEVTLDGTLGRGGALPGPDYLIGADLGQQRGGNLFHSFQEFNLNRLESATFSGPNSLNNIISRVTGGNFSNIDGLIRSTVPADMYFLNPNGIMFGPNARLDVQGSFHASTADYLRLGNGGRFDARNPSNSLLTVAPIASFGFLDNSHGKIEVNGRCGLNESGTPRALLQVPDGKSLSLIGGDIYLSQGMDELPVENLISLADGSNIRDISLEEYRAVLERNQRFSQLRAPGGTLNLASIQQAGEIALTKNGLHSTATQGGHIQLEQEAYISTTGESGGNMFIWAGEFMMDNSTVYARTLGELDGGVIDIQADNIEITDRTNIYGGTENTGDGTDIQLSANESIRLSNGTFTTKSSHQILGHNQPLGNAGHIHLQARDIRMENQGLASHSSGTGESGDIRLSAENSLNIVDGSYIQTSTFGDNILAGKGGTIYLQAETVNIEGSTFYALSQGSADAGQIVIQTGSLYMGKLNYSNTSSNLLTFSLGSGNGGQITIQADDILLEDGTRIDSRHLKNGNAGDIDIQAHNQLIIRGTNGGGTNGVGYATIITAMSDFVLSSTATRQTGKGGTIHIMAKEMRIEDGGQINAGSRSSSSQAGNIILEIKDTLILSGVNPYGENSEGFGSAISTSSHNAGDAGDIQIQAGSVAIQNGALIETDTDSQSRGGNIQIQASEQLTISGDASQISLNEPALAQINYLSTSLELQSYNQSTSGIYAHSTNQTVNSGDSGHIEVSTPLLVLGNKGQISTASKGGGQAGQIILNVEKLILSDNALIRSNSDFVNQLTFDSVPARNNFLISTGTVVKTEEIGNGKAIYQINLGNTLVNLLPITHVADMNALENLIEQTESDGINGDMVMVENVDYGQTARFIYFAKDGMNETWTRIDEDSQVVLEQFDVPSNGSFARGVQPPYANGTQIHVNDMGNDKAADFIYIHRSLTAHSLQGMTFVLASQVKYYQVADTTALQNLTTRINLLVGTQVDVDNSSDGNPARFVFDGNDWIRVGQMVEVPDLEAQQNLVLAKPGHIAHLPTGSTIYTGDKWIPLNRTEHITVANLEELYKLEAKNGDLIDVDDVNGQHEHFFYVDGQWIQQIRGGNAGQIVINADTIQLSNGSKISTGSISGGGGNVTLNVDKMVYLTDSQVSTSVQEGAGSGGDLTINGSQFVIMNNGQIIAQAYEGQGGNIHLGSKELVKSPCSQISASSELGIDGNVQIDSPAVDMDAMLVVLPGGHLDAQLPKKCRYESVDDINTFYIYPEHEGKMRNPDDFIE